METCSSSCCDIFSQINWLWYFISIIVVFATGAVWYSALFKKAWIRVFKIEMSKDAKPKGMAFTMIMQLIVTALLGLIIFMLTNICPCLAILVLIAFCGWQKGSLKFRYTKWTEFFTAAMIEVGYMFVAGIIFILFALI